MTDSILTALALVSLAAALLPAVLAAVNLAVLRRPAPEADPGLVSILIPARNEAGNIAGTVRAALASTTVPVEVIVGDDHSTDATAAIVRAIEDPRLRLVAVPALPEGWTGKNHACSHMAGLARGRQLLFIDADVRLAPEAAACLAAQARRTGATLVSGVPRQRTETLGEMLTVPMIDFLLLGYLPVPLMRRLPDPSLGAACGQLILADRAAYDATGGHSAIRTSLHDGVRLPRLFRAAGYRTDLAAAASLATCRMYDGFAQAWAGFSKNAHEGLATPRALPVWTLLLGCGQVLPPLLVLFGLLGLIPAAALVPAATAWALSLATRSAITLATRAPLATILLHPATVLVALAIQWNVLLRGERAGAATWKGRSYPVSGA
ncbi:glycosyltransferase [Methylobacterium sp. PvR107]|uniref:glycosyltransferase n=1 Tax=Methylobacterium sp. PvR107 TaxID=2806597 RepID=UPI001AE687B5|nr:glycosyltransferase family 2 protein [Methylobacterium sp. PvR107]MBP1182100.1 cellulose synthase/poly-beta-1,6-N-acetylglucosamine synthase-like glycosyltransferase [Methylobacterium sp. PvR107]